MAVTSGSEPLLIKILPCFISHPNVGNIMILHGQDGYVAGIAELSGLLTTVTIIFAVVYFRNWLRGSSENDDLATKKPDVAVPPPSETSPQDRCLTIKATPHSLGYLNPQFDH